MATRNDDILISRSASTLLRILFESMVLMHHLGAPSIPIISAINGIFGPLAVSGFILMSGYGVGLSFKKRRDKYLYSLLHRRIPKTYGLIVLTDVFYLLLFFLQENRFESFFSFLVSVLYLPFFKEFVYLSRWVYFMADLLIYYFMFLLFGHLFKKDDNALLKTAIGVMSLQAFIVLIVTVINAVTGNSGSLRGCFAFPIGLLLANYSSELAEAVHKHKEQLVVGLFVCGGLLFLCSDALFMKEYVTNTILALSMFFAFHGFSIRSHVLDIAGHLILVVYLSHELIFKALIYMFPKLSWQPRMLFTLIVVGALVVFLYFLIYYKCKSINRKRRATLSKESLA